MNKIIMQGTGTRIKLFTVVPVGYGTVPVSRLLVLVPVPVPVQTENKQSVGLPEIFRATGTVGYRYGMTNLPTGTGNQ